MSKIKCRHIAIKEIATLMTKCTDYMNSIEDDPLTTESPDKLSSLVDKIRWLQQGLENGFYED